MKKLVSFLANLLLCLTMFAQNQIAPLWIVGTEVGYAQVGGEVKARSGFGAGIYAAKPFNEYFSARLQLGMGTMRGLDRRPSENWLNHPSWNGTLNTSINYNLAAKDSIYANYKVNYQEASLQGVFTFTQLPTFKNGSQFDAFVLAGLGLMRFTTFVNAADANGMIYDFSKVDGMATGTEAQTIANLNTIFDETYETPTNASAMMTPTFQIGLGGKWHFRDDIAISVMHRISMTGTDRLDSYMWDANNKLDRVKDVQHFTTIGVNYTIYGQKKAKKPKVVLPPVEEPIDPIVEPTPPIELEEQEQEVVREAFRNTEFETGKAVIRVGSYASLNDLANLLLRHPSWKLRIVGHTDAAGSEEFNLQLSKERAEAVRDYLVGKGVTADKFLVSWYGESQPIATNDTEEGRQKNRRVEMEIVE